MKVLWNNQWLWRIPGEDIICRRQDPTVCVTWNSSGGTLPPAPGPLCHSSVSPLSHISAPILYDGDRVLSLGLDHRSHKMTSQGAAGILSWASHGWRWTRSQEGGTQTLCLEKDWQMFQDCVWPGTKPLKPAMAGQNTSTLQSPPPFLFSFL